MKKKKQQIIQKQIYLSGILQVEVKVRYWKKINGWFWHMGKKFSERKNILHNIGNQFRSNMSLHKLTTRGNWALIEVLYQVYRQIYICHCSHWMGVFYCIWQLYFNIPVAAREMLTSYFILPILLSTETLPMSSSSRYPIVHSLVCSAGGRLSSDIKDLSIVCPTEVRLPFSPPITVFVMS